MRYSRYENYVQCKEAWIQSYPSHWSLSRISQAAHLINGYPFDSTLFSSDSGTPLVRIRDIGSHAASINYDGVVPKVALIDTGDILIGMDGDFNVRMWGGGHAALNQRVACVRAKYSDLQKFIFYVLPFPLKIVNDLTYFTTVKHLSGSDIERAVFPLPPNDEFRSIVKFLDRETAKIDLVIEKQQRLIELLEEKRQAVISHAVTKGLNPDAPMKDSGVEWLGEVPEHWNTLQLRRLIKKVQTGNTPKDADEHHFDSVGLPWYGPGDFTESIYLNKAARNLSELGRKETRIFPPETVMLVGIGATIGKVSLTNVESSANQQINGIFCNDLLAPSFCTYYLRTIRDYIVKCGKCTTLPIINQEETKNLVVIVPPIEEQQDIVKHIERQTLKLDTLVEKAQSAINLLKERRTALISAAITGKIDVRDQVPHDVEEAVAS